MSDLHARLLAELDERDRTGQHGPLVPALRAVVELHAPEPYTTYSAGLPVEIQMCWHCGSLCHSGSGLSCDDPTDGAYPCSTIQAIARELGVETGDDRG